MKIFQGLLGLLQSKKGWMGLLILFISAYLEHSRALSPAFAAIVGTIGSFFMWTAHKTDLASMAWNYQAYQPYPQPYPMQSPIGTPDAPINPMGIEGRTP